jgi:GNAT superfamily N-acetyltransferase
MVFTGYRLQENLFQRVHFYVDDLVTEGRARSTGHGRALLDWLKTEARRAGCVRLVLDTALTNALGHRPYYRQGLLARATRFSVDLDAAAA